MHFIEQVFLVDLWTFHRLGYSFKKAPRHGEEPDTSFRCVRPLYACS